MAVAARRERKLKQEDVATQVERITTLAGQHLSATQALISQIESGKITSSRLIRPMCELLQIPEPMHFTDELMKAWWTAGHLLRGKNMALFRSQLDAMQSTLKALGLSSADVPANGDTPPDKTRK
jgi:transcriptional regulator with XRE-family HTH domain